MEKSTFDQRKTCSDCRFSDRLMHESGDLKLICRATPPVVAHAFMPTGPTSGQVVQQSLWPVMTIGDWCGKLETRQN